jgi:hypothetical protein
LFIFNNLKWPLEGVGKVSRWIGERAGARQREPGRARDNNGTLAVACRALVGELQRRGARSGEENVCRRIGIKGREPRFVRGFDRQQMQRPDRDRPATAQRIYGAGSGFRIAQNANSVTRGT